MTPDEFNTAFDEFRTSDQFAIIMRYQAGSVLGYERTTDIDWCGQQWDAALAASISLAEYLTLR